jgi:hypothetical protein
MTSITILQHLRAHQAVARPDDQGGHRLAHVDLDRGVERVAGRLAGSARVGPPGPRKLIRRSTGSRNASSGRDRRPVVLPHGLLIVAGGRVGGMGSSRSGSSHHVVVLSDQRPTTVAAYATGDRSPGYQILQAALRACRFLAVGDDSTCCGSG